MICTAIDIFFNNISHSKPWSLLGLDVGKKKIGVAYVSSVASVVLPIALIEQTKISKQLEAIKSIAQDRKINGMVIGWPLEMSGNVGIQAIEINKFATKLAELIDIPIYLQDERMSTALANRLLLESSLNRRKRNSVDDQVSATIILDNFLTLTKGL